MTDRSEFSETPLRQQVLSVAQLSALIKDVLESTFPVVWVAGEIADLARPRSGHCYFTLKDPDAQLPAVLWRSTMGRVRFDLRDGLEVVCRGHLEVYAPRGRYQLIVEAVEPRGIGALELALRQLHEKLAKEGLFDAARKRPLPRFPRRIAVVTSPTGAALRDFLEVLRRRWRASDVLVVPVRVQGEGAAEEIAAAIALVNRLAVPVDCLVVTRGGGSLEDLWAFNEEIVVRAIVASRIPVVSGVGHEIDVTLADLAADVRALTPSEAAERVVPAASEVAQTLQQYRQRLSASLRSRAEAARDRLTALARQRIFRRPLAMVYDRVRQLDELESRSLRGLRQQVERAEGRVESLAARLEGLSPLAVLGRGYSLTRRLADGRIIRDARELAVGEQLDTRFAHGQAVSRVEQIEGT
jgi:exodeoxyribonuclease VII large subunit